MRYGWIALLGSFALGGCSAVGAEANASSASAVTDDEDLASILAKDLDPETRAASHADPNAM